ncbi:hypothetical protein BHYA_0019g00070 [Botrytis hyacinthi]|uniref:Uncharacterized protein n=1 Tax=Botrytis hyacinthi TaxID=278943 RepID=A0A4Z1GYK6_9HELO|nr:hypothetical protein BHYA_0019g00070 [Botrytis hyacinthi]
MALLSQNHLFLHVASSSCATAAWNDTRRNDTKGVRPRALRILRGANVKSIQDPKMHLPTEFSQVILWMVLYFTSNPQININFFITR